MAEPSKTKDLVAFPSGFPFHFRCIVQEFSAADRVVLVGQQERLQRAECLILGFAVEAPVAPHGTVDVLQHGRAQAVDAG